jgi:hypothetical protein
MDDVVINSPESGASAEDGQDRFAYLEADGIALPQKLRDAELQRLLEAAWEAHVVLHRTAVADMAPDNDEYTDGPIDLWWDGADVASAERQLGRRYVEGLRGDRGDPLADLPQEMRDDYLWLLAGESLVKICYDEGLRRISQSETMWATGDWDGLLRSGYISEEVHAQMSRAYPGGNPRTAKRGGVKSPE